MKAVKADRETTGVAGAAEDEAVDTPVDGSVG
jgi:hypothetical protein